MQRGPGVLNAIAAQAAGAYVWSATHTNRWRWVNRPVAEAAWGSGAGVIVVTWHARLLLAHVGWVLEKGHQPVRCLMSQSKQGQMISRAMAYVGVGSIFGSSAKKGKAKRAVSAMREMKRHVDSGGCVALTPDGPTGPRHVAKLGPIHLARITGAPIIGLAWSAKGARVLDTWDGLLWPPLFAPGVFVWGGPITVPREADEGLMEARRQEMEAMLNAIGARADGEAGVDTTPPRGRSRQQTPNRQPEAIEA